MYSDIIPPHKKNKLSKIKVPKDHVEDQGIKKLKAEPFVAQGEVYHTAYGQDRKSKLPAILVILTLVTLAIVYYSIFNNKTRITFESKSTIFDIKDRIPMALSEKNQNSSTTLSYNLIYNNENKDRNIFAPTVEESTSTLKVDMVPSTEYYTLNNSTTTPTASIKVKLVNEFTTNVQVIKDTRFDVNGVTYYIDRAVDLKKTASLATSTNKYKVIGFKGTPRYEKFYAVDYVDTSIPADTEVIKNDKNSPNNDILSLIPDNFIPLKKNYVYDKSIDQTALVVIDKKDFEKVLLADTKLIQEYVKSFITISDLVEYEISINDYDIELDSITGLPIAFKNLNLEIIPRVKRDKVATTFKGFSKDTIKKIKNEIAKNITMNVSYSPFWITKVSDEDNISVEVK
jgi:hypothetical protein